MCCCVVTTPDGGTQQRVDRPKSYLMPPAIDTSCALPVGAKSKLSPCSCLTDSEGVFGCRSRQGHNTHLVRQPQSVALDLRSESGIGVEGQSVDAESVTIPLPIDSARSQPSDVGTSLPGSPGDSKSQLGMVNTQSLFSPRRAVDSGATGGLTWAVPRTVAV